MDNEKDIIVSCQQGDLEKFSWLYDKYIKKIYDFIYFKTTHKETAKDLTSQTFFKALEKIKTFNSDKGTFSAWLYQIARNTVIDHYRTRKKTVDIDDVWDMAEDQDIERDIDVQEKLKSVEKHLAKLKSEQREIIIMRIWQDMSYAEIAEALDKSEGSCKMAFSRAINTLRREMPLEIFIMFLLLRW